MHTRDSLTAFDRSHRGRSPTWNSRATSWIEVPAAAEKQPAERPATLKEGEAEPVKGQDHGSPEIDDGVTSKSPSCPWTAPGHRHQVHGGGQALCWPQRDRNIQFQGGTSENREHSGRPPDINILPAYGRDPRVVSNLIDGVNRTQDDTCTSGCTPTPGAKSHSTSMDFVQLASGP